MGRILLYFLAGFFVLFAGLVVFLSFLPRIMGGMSVKKARGKLEEYLLQEFGEVLEITQLNRFFHEGNMNPNLFFVELQEVERPDIRFCIDFDAKKNTAFYGGEITREEDIHLAHQRHIIDYEARLDIGRQFVDTQLRIIGYEPFSITLTQEPDDWRMKALAQQLADAFNQRASELILFGSQRLIFKTPKFPDGLLQLKLVEEIAHGWIVLEEFGVNESSVHFQEILTALRTTRYEFEKPIGRTWKYGEKLQVFVRKPDLDELAIILFMTDHKAPGAFYGYDPVVAFHLLRYDLSTRRTVFHQLYRRDHIPDAYYDELCAIQQELPKGYPKTDPE